MTDDIDHLLPIGEMSSPIILKKKSVGVIGYR